MLKGASDGGAREQHAKEPRTLANHRRFSARIDAHCDHAVRTCAHGGQIARRFPPSREQHRSLASLVVRSRTRACCLQARDRPSWRASPRRLRLRGAGGSLAVGLVLGVVLFCLLVGIAALFGVYHVVGNGNASELLPDLVAIGIVPAFLEELLFRGIIFRWLEEFGGSWLALALTSGLFGAAHAFNPGATWWSALAIVVEAGVLLGSAYMLARNLWAPMGLHGAWNFTQGFVFGAPVSGMSVHGLIQAKLSGPVLLSGGAFGLEASMIGVVLSLPLGTGILILTVQRGGLFQPWWVRRRDRCAKT